MSLLVSVAGLPRSHPGDFLSKQLAERLHVDGKTGGDGSPTTAH